MTEATDPIAFGEGQPQEAPSEAPREETLGDGMMSGTLLGDPVQSEGQPDDSEPEAPQGEANETNAPTPSEETEEERQGRLRYEDYTRKRQQDAEDRRRWEEQLRQREAALVEREQASQQPPQQQNGVQSRLEQLANDPNLDPQSRAGVQVLHDLQTTVNDQAQVIQELRSQMEQFGPRLEQTSRVAQQFTAEQEAQIQSVAAEQLAEAQTALGADTVRQWGHMVKQAFFPSGDIASWSPPVDPQGNPLTMAEYLSRVSGKQLESQQSVIQGNSQARSRAKTRASAQGADTTAPDAGPISREEALAGW